MRIWRAWTSPGRAWFARPDRRIVAAALLLITALGWFYLAAVPMPMPGISGVWSPSYLVLSVAMWFVMMVAMMTPSVAPVVLLYDRVMHRDQRGWHRRTSAFLLGYLLVWAGFSAAATFAQAALIRAGFIDAMGVVGTHGGAALLLLAVALYQFSPAKVACLDHCHSPLGFIVRRRRGPLRDLRAGLAHGAWCVGCCGALMLLLFAGGVMNLAWVAAITVAVAIEKLSIQPDCVRIGIGIAALCAAAWLAWLQ
jgi:predicted metal-binding membrane protein